ncbi:zinc-finger domain-containing protein [Rossellomorea marisflavi]|uniref:zinc-finger domain-containing protein n=1 Tax=Rossellomorea TaxID=2837508 RepID=UPI0009E4EEDE|nr:zinc-finger domain-containing protein [Rossellomorea marisflavi]MCM2604946.1 zinc-finger domain-containing protein [Rossellomorea marisflavi]QHA36671.1 zinc-finger domain-containing protein [Rossellomorea marisflavi]TYO72863.1 zinc-finger domain-containing protein [Rossellomorea marisflavi]
MDRKQLIDKVDELSDAYCKGCLLKAHFRKEYGKTHAHRFCIEECTVGREIRRYGERLG